MENAACAGHAPNAREGEPDPWFPERGQAHVRKAGEEICRSCPVMFECIEYRDRTNTRYGMWAGIMAKRTDE